MKVAPALAASSAWAAEKHRVTLTIEPSPVSALHAFRPSGVSGTLIAILSRDLPEHLRLAHHAVVVERDHLGGDRSLHDAGDLPDHLEEIAAGFVDQGRDWW